MTCPLNILVVNTLVSPFFQVANRKHSLFTSEAVKLAVAKLDALLNESGSSKSEYKGGKEGSVTEDDSESEGEPEDEEGDGEERTTKKKRGKQPKKGHLARDQIIAAVAAMSEAPSPFGAAKGRVGSKG